MKLKIAAKNIPLLATISVFVLLFAGSSFFLKGFFSLQVFINLFSENAFLGIAALGMTFVILSGGIDLSVGALIGFSSILLSRLIMDIGIHPVIAFAIVLLSGVILGTGMGCLIHFFNQPPFLITLAGMFLARGLGFVIKMEAMPVRHEFYKQINALSLPLGHTAFIPFTAFIFVILAVITWYISLYAKFGRNIYAMGGSEQSALLMGLPVRRTKIGVYAFSGFCASLAGIVYSLYTFSGNPTAGTTLELDAIAAVVIGGTPLIGGIGSPIGTVVGVLILGVIQTSIMFQGSLSSWWTKIVIGILLLAFILLQNLFQRKL
ncbi:sugar ABC transporter permease YjfF [Candidatus Sumerlaeota bacterium]|nr:sugar ABC transporter permease YjfF [Candidatus Sumerlaeota bacterium]